MIKAIITDWDGVVYDSLRAHLSFYKRMCEQAGINFKQALNSYLRKNNKQLSDFGNTLEAYKFFINRPVHYLQYFKDLGINWEANKELADKIYREEMTNSVELFPGMIELFEELRNKGVKVGIVSSTFKEVIMSNHGDLFDAVIAGSDSAKPRPDGINKCLKLLSVKPGDAIYLGDMVTDAMAAKAAGVNFIGVSWGYHYPDLISNEPVLRIVDSVETLKKVLFHYI